MSAPTVMLEYQRAGGRAPSDDERLLVHEDGSFQARRTVGGRRIGTFAGQLGPDALERCRVAVGGLAEVGDLHLLTPADGATESIRIAHGEARLGSNEQPEGPWAALIEALRELIDGEILDKPVAALALQATTGSASLAHVGDQPLEFEPASLATRVVRLDAQGLVLGRWQAAARDIESGSAASPAWQRVAPGTTLPLPFEHRFELETGDWLQVWVSLSIRQADQVRDARLFAGVPA